MTILDKIIEHKAFEIRSSKKIISVEDLKESPLYDRICLNFAESIRSKNGVIAEFKRKSPSKGLINGEVSVESVVKGYENAGVSAVSVLTDTSYFGGTFNDLLRARAVLQIPILRKDFMIDSYQLHEAKALGADIILLIAAGLDQNQCAELAQEAKSLGLNAFLEIHSEEELNYVSSHIDVVGINNRNLKTFEVDIENSIRLSEQLPQELPKIAESGISDPEVLNHLKSMGFDGFLIGENFMKTVDPGATCKRFIEATSLQK